MYAALPIGDRIVAVGRSLRPIATLQQRLLEAQPQVLELGLGGVESRPIVVDTNAFLGKPADANLAADIARAAAAAVSPMSDFKATGITSVVAAAPTRNSSARAMRPR